VLGRKNFTGKENPAKGGEIALFESPARLQERQH
jgi:hypothetical protein